MGWDAAYDLWTDDWTNETMIWNQWAGDNSYWAQCANNQVSGGCGTEPGVAVTLDGVPYHFLANGPTNSNGTPIPCTTAMKPSANTCSSATARCRPARLTSWRLGSGKWRTATPRPATCPRSSSTASNQLHQRHGDVPDDGPVLQPELGA